MKTVVLVAAASFFLVVGQAQGAIVNGSFETGDFTGWTLNYPSLAGAVSSLDGKAPTDGTYFARLSAGGGVGLFITLSQSFTADANAALSFDVYFRTTDSGSYNDQTYVKLFTDGGALVSQLWYYDVAMVGDFGSTPWVHVSYTIPTAGTYRIEAGVANILDNGSPSYVGLDDVQLSGGGVTVPEPATMVVWGLLGAVAAGNRWRRRSAA